MLASEFAIAKANLTNILNDGFFAFSCLPTLILSGSKGAAGDRPLYILIAINLSLNSDS